MYFHNVNLYAVLGSTVAAMLLGMLWYSPLLLQRRWMRLMGCEPGDAVKAAELHKRARSTAVVSIASAFLSALVLGKIISLSGVLSPLYGMKIAAAVWLAFVTPVQLTASIFSREPLQLYFINTGYQLARYLTIGAILTKWM